ncbi:phosphatase PAP2 family protein [Peribacillus muralis]|uniref:phosphatase PAP2 family protein n=1 Tax=Peribacillus muralis TaxID=264697 RepID=UPI001F4D8127|nr:phosphatase PAP2 family protein [Peribacillus muralis]MCK1992057.1 phosphatase PAP2 family protein [Peribacillus muralis]MCK2012613.1 phosphatase PAP2 family protein [Peribacillus muralis]
MKNKSILPLHPLWYLLLLVVTSSIYSIINQSSGHAVDVTTIIDGEIPFIKEFVVPYLLWYPYIYGLLIYYCFVDRKNYFVALGSLVSGKLICFLVYCLWQSTVPRPEVVGNDIFAHLMRVVYSHDQPVNCLPSIHVLTTFIMMIIVHKRKEQHKWEYIGVTAMGTLIIFSTLFTKQHAVLDVLSGILLACGVYAAIQYMFQALSAHQANHYPARQMKK